MGNKDQDLDIYIYYGGNREGTLFYSIVYYAPDTFC